jgi:MFS transporter, putative metabolite:H+ symporter
MKNQRAVTLAIIASALGFFVDLYDIIIVSVVRKASLLAVGVPESELLDKGVLMLNVQMAGMLIGGFLWGILGDKKGRLSVLFGSIILYSAATFANGYATSYEMYLLLRFLAGVGLSGELGAGITLVSEQMPQKWRGIGPSIIGSFGMLGAIVGAYIGGQYDWQLTYKIGGIMGFALLILRFGVLESGMYQHIKTKTNNLGSLGLIFKNKKRLLIYISIILMGFPGWFINGVVMTFTPEIAKDMGMAEIPSVSVVFMVFFAGFTFGDLTGGFVSQWLKSRKKALWAYLGWFMLIFALYLFFARTSVTAYYIFFFGLGIGAGYTIVLLTSAAEHFGTNIRSTVTTSTLNLLRASVIPQATAFSFLSPKIGSFNSIIVVGICSMGLAVWALTNLKETFHSDLDFIDE